MRERQRRTKIEERVTIEVDGAPRRLAWVAGNRPEILMRKILGGEDRYWSPLHQAGYTREKALKKCREWNLDAGILGHIED